MAALTARAVLSECELLQVADRTTATTSFAALGPLAIWRPTGPINLSFIGTGLDAEFLW